MDIVVITAILASLFVVIGLSEPLADKLRLPYSVILAIVGILIGAGAVFFLRTDLTDALNPVAEAILALPIRSNVFLYVFLPTLLFQATLGMDLRRMLDDWVPILVLAVVAVFVATFLVGYALSWASALPLVACLLIGSIVSTTDPSAVVSIFRSISAPRRLARIIEGESLLNDAAAVALFGLFMAFVALGVPDPTLGDAALQFPFLMAGGALTGWVAARACIWLMAAFARHELAQVSVSVALPYLAYTIAEQSVGASGVIAVVTAGMTLNLLGPGRLTPSAWASLREVWELLAYWAGAFIFILAALLIPRLLEEVRASDLLLLAVVIGAATVARAIILFGLLPFLSLARLSPRVEPTFSTAILWGGLRGAVTLALALAVTESFRVPEEIRRIVGILATGYTLFTLIVQGTTLRAVIRFLKLDRLSSLDEALSRQVVAVALQSVRETVSRTTGDYELSHDIVRAEAKQFGQRLDRAVDAAEEGREILDRDRITLGLVSLAGAEREAILKGIRERTISARMSDQVLTNADRLIEAARLGGRSGYGRAAMRSVAYGRSFRFAVALHNRLGVSYPLARMTADRFEFLLSQRLILRDLGGFIEGRIRRIHGRRVADLLHGLLNRRVEAVETALEGLRLQYPGYAEELERRFIRRTALRLEEGEYTSMYDDGLIGAEPYAVLIQDIDARRAAFESRPELDIKLQRSEMIRQFPLFSGLDDAEIKLISRALRTRFVNPGDIILRKADPAKSVYFIASGAVELDIAGQVWRLGRGDMFGEYALLKNNALRTEASAITPCTLLVLHKTRFRKLLDRSNALREALTKAAEKRGAGLLVPVDDENGATTV
ncbi:MAG: cation:proton antiporter [Pseudomonadota bacterium]